MAPLLSIAPQIRAHYVGGLLRSFESLRAGQTPAAMEILLEVSRECPRAFRLFRADMIGTKEGEPRLTEFNAPTHLSFPPMAWEDDGVEFVLGPLTWNDVCIDLAVPDAQAVTHLLTSLKHAGATRIALSSSSIEEEEVEG